MPSPKVVVIVLNWCGELDTIACIESLQRSTQSGIQILLLDNGSPDGSGDRLHARFPAIPYLQTGVNLGYAGGNNRGFERALRDGTDYVVVLNNDTVVDPHCVEHMVRAAEETGVAVVAPKILYHDAPEVQWYAGGDFSTLRALGIHRGLDKPESASAARSAISFVTGCCFLIRADALRAVGGFDESYFAYVEDVELSIRLTSRGFALLYEPQARVFHRIPQGPTRETPFQIRQRDRNRRRLVRTHYDLLRRLVFAAWFYPTRAVHLVRYLLRAAWPEATAVIVGMFGTLAPQAADPTDIRTRAPQSMPDV